MLTAGIAVVMAGCGSTGVRAPAASGGVPGAIERQVSDTQPTSLPSPTRPSGVPADAGVPLIGIDDIVGLYDRHGPDVGLDADDISEGDRIVLQTACELLVGATGDDDRILVRSSFEAWFRSQLEAAAAPAAYIDSWDPLGMLDDLADLGCKPSTSPRPADLG